MREVHGRVRTLFLFEAGFLVCRALSRDISGKLHRLRQPSATMQSHSAGVPHKAPGFRQGQDATSSQLVHTALIPAMCGIVPTASARLLRPPASPAPPRAAAGAQLGQFDGILFELPGAGLRTGQPRATHRPAAATDTAGSSDASITSKLCGRRNLFVRSIPCTQCHCCRGGSGLQAVATQRTTEPLKRLSMFRIVSPNSRRCLPVWTPPHRWLHRSCGVAHTTTLRWCSHQPQSHAASPVGCSCTCRLKRQVHMRVLSRRAPTGHTFSSPRSPAAAPTGRQARKETSPCKLGRSPTAYPRSPPQ